MSRKSGFVYMMTNHDNKVIYTGVTNNLIKRVYEHKLELVQGFTSKYRTKKLVYYEMFDSITSAIEREKQIKGGSRKDKIALIESVNNRFDDLYDNIKV